MPKGTARSHGSSGEVINHFNAVRLRVIGQGSLKLKLKSMQDVQEQQLADLPMSLRTDTSPTRLANFTNQRASLEIQTTSINDYFRINRIIIFSRPVASEYPS